MKKDTNIDWAKICSLFSNEQKTRNVEAAVNKANSEEKELFEMINKDMETIDKTAYMFDKQTDEAWSILHTKIHAHEKGERRFLSFKHKPLLKIAASIVLLIGLTWVSLSVYNQSKIEFIKTKAFQSTQILPDGTTVYLNANSTIEYSKQFATDLREVKLNGEAFFEVVKDPNRPFIITANNTQIEVLGTSFNVLTNKKHDKTEVFVKSGTVRVSNKKSLGELILTKDQFASSDNKILSREILDDLNYLSWKTKRIQFNEVPLNNVIEILNKTYASNIIIGNNVSTNFKLNAKFEKTSIDTVLKSICLAFDLEQKTIEGGIQLTNKIE